MSSAARLLAGVLALAALTAGSAQAASFGHARLASAVGEPLLILVPVSDLTTADVQALSARTAPAADWVASGLTPPVALDSLTIAVTPGIQAKDRRVLRVASSQVFSGTLADLLLDVHTATGEQRYQVSLLAPGPLRVETPAGRSAASAQAASAVGAASSPDSTHQTPVIAVRSGDTMFAIARRHAVEGVSVYQWMMALQRANPQAFIHHNINLVRAGASLSVPSVDDMLSISDAQARRQFQDQTAAFARLQGRQAANVAAVDAQAGGGAVSSDTTDPRLSADAGTGDRVQLSQDDPSADADLRTAQGHALQEAESRVGQLQDNVQSLNEALQSQGKAARTAAAQGAQAVGESVQQIASAISEASQEAAAQANARTQQADPSADGAAGASTPPSSASILPGAPAGLSPKPAADAATDAVVAASSGADVDLQVSQQAEHRASWIQDHLLWVMTALLAIIVFIIAWLLRRANHTRHEADDSPRITEAMVREKLQGVDLELPPRDTPPTPPQA